MHLFRFRIPQIVYLSITSQKRQFRSSLLCLDAIYCYQKPPKESFASQQTRQADDMTGFDRLFGYLLVTDSFCCRRHFQVELFEWTAIKRCWGGGGLPPSHQHHGFFTCQGDMTANREGSSLKSYDTDQLSYLEKFKTPREQQLCTLNLNFVGQLFMTRLKPGKKTLKINWVPQLSYAAQLIITIVIMMTLTVRCLSACSDTADHRSTVWPITGSN